MTFRDTATTELNALVEKLSTAADAAARAAAAETEAKARAAVAEIEAKTRVTIEALTAEKAKVERALQEETRAKAALEKARTSLEQAGAAIEKTRAALEKERDGLKTALDAARADTTSAKRELQAKVDSAHAETEKARREAQAKLDAVQAKLDAGKSEADAVRRDFQTKLDEARRIAADATTRAKEWRLEQARAMRDQSITFVSRSMDRLIAVSEAFADVTTADDVLSALVDGLTTEFSRVVLFKVRGGRLEGVQRQVGFKFPADSSHLVVPYPIDSVLDRAINSGQIETVSADTLEPTAGTAFGGTAACGLALPIDINGEPRALIYADDSGLPNQEFANVDLRRKFADLLRQQAIPLLLRLPSELKVVAEFREYATRLVAELENMYAADVGAKKKGEELRRRLKDNVECARGIYAHRVAAEAPSAGSLIEEELAAVVNTKRGTAYGRDLSAVLGDKEDSARRPQAAAAAVEA